ncbi:MAG: trypsin-like serine protease [Candidatus Binatia bacterium]
MSLRSATVGALAALLLVEPGSAIIVRHDRDDAAYRQLAVGSPTPCAMNLPGGEGTLISPRWIATAAHVARHLKVRGTVRCGAAAYSISRVETFPDGTEGRDDLALVQVAEPVAGSAPVPLYRGRDELGATMTFLGRGRFGTGVAGPATSDGVLRGATNVVERVHERLLIFRFDAPPAGTDLEGISGPGDSGGPALLQVDGRVYLAGISSGQDARAQGGREGVYGVIEYYTRVSSYVDWIEGILRVSEGGGVGPLAPVRIEEVLPELLSDASAPRAYIALSPDGRTLYVSRYTEFGGDGPTSIEVARRDPSGWSPLAVAPFSGIHADRQPFVAPDGHHLYFVSRRPVRGIEREDSELWRVTITASGWGEPEHLAALSSPGDEYAPSVASSGRIYFSSTRDGGAGSGDLYVAEPSKGSFLPPVNLGAPINGQSGEWGSSVDASESRLVFESSDRDQNLSESGDLYLAERTGAGWTTPRHLEPPISSERSDLAPRLSADGRTLVFSSNRSGVLRTYRIPIAEPAPPRSNGGGVRP